MEQEGSSESMPSDGGSRADASSSNLPPTLIEALKDPATAEAAKRLPPGLLEALSQPGIPAQVVSMTIAAWSRTTTNFQGPLPPGEQLRIYEDVLPGAADRILSMAERQQTARLDMEQLTVREATNRSWWGLRLGFVIALAVIGVGAGAIFTGHALAGFALIVAQAAALAGVFAIGRVEQRKERVEKDALTRPKTDRREMPPPN